MKTWGMLLFSAILLAQLVPAQASLLMWYKFDETSGSLANDSSGNNHHENLSGFSFSGGSNWAPSGGQFGGALHFDGSDDIIINDSLSQSASAFTYSFWFNPDSNLGAGSGRQDFFYGRSFARPHITFDREGDGRVGIYITGGGTSAIHTQAKSTTGSWTANTWHHLAFTFDGNDYKVYVNGQLESTLNLPGTSTTSTGFHMGAANGNTQNFDGLLDDFGIWDEALDSTSIQSVFTSGINGFTNPNPVPEPSSIALCLLGWGLFGLRKLW